MINLQIRIVQYLFYLFLKGIYWANGTIREDTGTDVLLFLLKLFSGNKMARDERKNEKTSGSDFIIEYFSNKQKFHVYYQAKKVFLSSHQDINKKIPMINLGHRTKSYDIYDWLISNYSIFHEKVFSRNFNLFLLGYDLQIVNQVIYCFENGYFPSYCFYAFWGHDTCSIKYKRMYALTHAKTTDLLKGYSDNKQRITSNVEFLNLNGLKTYRQELRPNEGGFFGFDESSDLTKLYNEYRDSMQDNMTIIKSTLLSHVEEIFLNIDDKNINSDSVKEIISNYRKKIELLFNTEHIPPLKEISHQDNFNNINVIKIKV